jgi:hypothetical protein
MQVASIFPPGFEDEGRNIAVDFDGVVHVFDRGFFNGTCYGDPIPGAIEAIRTLAKRYRVVIFTAKAKPNRPLVNGKTGTQLVEEWLIKYGIRECVAEITSEKPRAFLYIDDNAYRFKNWADTFVFLESEFENKTK